LEYYTMATNLNIMVAQASLPHARLRTEMCEHKGTGHPDSICDGLAEAVSQALCSAYLRAYGEIRHHNVDKALLIGAQSSPHFGGGQTEARVRLIIAGRADPLPGMDDVPGIVCAAARDYIAANLRCPADLFDVESAVRSGSPNLRRVVTPASAVPLANDTSFGVGFAPYSQLEQTVLRVAELLKFVPFRAAFPAAGDDFKVMGMRMDDRLTLTIALAFIDREVKSSAHYFSLKADMGKWLSDSLGRPCDIRINTLDDIEAKDESGIYLTVTGLSAEHGDDGQVGRGNRVSGLITPSRPMSLEAAAGKNPVSHVGKIYNVLASKLAADLVSHIPIVDEAVVQILSCIGQPINRPQLVDIQVASEASLLDECTIHRIREIAADHLGHIGSLTRQLARGDVRVF
jgi:S-adenosylmethionine synthetase